MVDNWPLAFALLFIFFAPSSCEKQHSTPLGEAIVTYMETGNGKPR